ncbi:MAG: hypothetical protein ABH864_04635 [archaeon]
MTSKPTTFTPSAHTQSWSTITGKPSPSVGGEYSAATGGGTYFTRTSMGGAQWDFCALTGQDATYWGGGGRCSCRVWYKSSTPPQWYLEANEPNGASDECDISCVGRCFDFG